MNNSKGKERMRAKDLTERIKESMGYPLSFGADKQPGTGYPMTFSRNQALDGEGTRIENSAANNGLQDDANPVLDADDVQALLQDQPDNKV